VPEKRATAEFRSSIPPDEPGGLLLECLSNMNDSKTSS